MVRDDSIKRIWRGRLIRYAPLVLWIGVIFFLSSGQASMSETSRIIRPILEFLFPSASEETLRFYVFSIRKLAHFVEYAVLAFFAARAFYNSSSRYVKNLWFAGALLLVVIVASIDETNQAYTSSRTGSLWDVLLDFAGGLAMILILWLWKVRSEPPAVAGG